MKGAAVKECGTRVQIKDAVFTLQATGGSLLCARVGILVLGKAEVAVFGMDKCSWIISIKSMYRSRGGRKAICKCMCSERS